MALQGKDLGALVGQMGMDTKQWDAAFAKMQGDMSRMEVQAQSSMQRVQQAFSAAGQRMQSMGRRLTTSVTLPIVGVGALAVREFGNFDQAMTNSLAIMGDVSDSMRNEMAEAAREMGRITMFNAQQAAESYFFLASAGLDAEQSIAALPQVAQFAQAGMFDMALATDLATDAQSALGMTVQDTEQNLENLTKITDTLVGANTLANASVQQFAEALTSDAGATMRAFSIRMEEGVAVLAAFADQGTKGADAGSSFARMVRLLTKGARDNAEAFKRFNIQVFNAEGNLNNMADILGQMEQAFQGMGVEAKGAALEQLGFNALAQRAILPLLGTSEAIREYEKRLESMGGITQEVADKQLQTFNAQLGLLWDNIRDVALEFGQTMVPALQRLIGWLREVVDRFRGLEEGIKVRIVAIAGLFAAAGPLLTALGLMASAIGALSVPILAAIGTIGTAAFLVISNWDKVTEYFTTGPGARMWKDFTEIIQGAIKIITDIWETFGDEFLAVAQFSFGQVLKIIEMTLSRVNELMKVFNGEFERELNIWEDNILTTARKIDNIITGTIVEAFRIAGRAIKDVFFSQIGDFDIGNILGMDVSGTADELSKVTAKIGEVEEEIARVQDRASKGLISLEQRDEEIARLGDFATSLMELRSRIIEMKNARKEDNQAGQESIDINEELNKILGNQATQVSTLGGMLAENTERYEAIINKVGELTEAEINEARALALQNQRIREQIEERQRLTEVIKGSERANRNVTESYEESINRISQGFLKLVPMVKNAGEDINEEWDEMAWRMEQAADSMANTLLGLGTSFFESLGYIMATGEGIGQAFLSILNSIADMAIQLGMIIVASGKAIEALKASLVGFFGGSAIIAGAALIAVGAAAKGAIRGLASGGRSGGGSAVTAQGPTARSVPAANQEVVFRIGNNELIGSLQQAGVIDQRVGKRRNFGGS